MPTIVPGPVPKGGAGPTDTRNAYLARYTLNEIGAITFGIVDPDHNPDHAEIDESRRVALHQWVDALSPTERASIYEFVRLFVVEPLAV